MNLFSSPLDRVTFRHLESFLGLALPENQRLKEGERIDYKVDIPQDLGDWVTAFANVSGGLIFVGIKSDKQKQNIPVAWPGITETADLETQLSAKILSTVRPKAEFEIATIPVSKGKVIVVIRVSEGTYPPYEYQQGANTKITLRVHDARKSANVREIESLLKKRNEGAVASEQTILNYVNATGFDCITASGHGDAEYQRIVVLPKKDARIRLDSVLEKEFEKKILEHFRNEKNVSLSDRRGYYIQLQSKNNSFPCWHRLWRIYHNGCFSFAGTLRGEFPEGKPIGDLAHNLLSACRLAREILNENDFHGEVYLGEFIRTNTIKLLPQFPEHLPLGKYYTTGAIDVPQLKEGLPDRSFTYTSLDISELGEPYEKIAEILMHNLRELRQVMVEYQGFLSSIQQMRT
jgi:hypothetical protein